MHVLGGTEDSQRATAALGGRLLFAGIWLPLRTCVFSRRKNPAETDLSQLAELILHTCVLWELTEGSLAGGVKNQYLLMCLNMRGLVLAVQGESEYNKKKKSEASVGFTEYWESLKTKVVFCPLASIQLGF